MLAFDRKFNLVLEVDSLIGILRVLAKAEQVGIKNAEYATNFILTNMGECNEVKPETTQPQTDTWQEFHASVVKMNETYDLPVNEFPKLMPNQVIRTQQFMDILRKELAEGDDILTKLQSQGTFNSEDTLNALTDLADWYGDIIVYVTSEAVRNGIPLMNVLDLIMASNQTKLGADGKPIKDENDKFLKGPNFVPPEPAIKLLLSNLRGNKVLADKVETIKLFRDTYA